MKFTDQTIAGPTEGNCLAACLASLLEISIDNIPVVKEEDENWLENMNKWFHKEHGIILLGVDICKKNIPDIPLIAVGKSHAYKGVDHAVLYKNDELIFDPSSCKRGIKGKVKYYLLILKDYS